MVQLVDHVVHVVGETADLRDDPGGETRDVGWRRPSLRKKGGGELSGVHVRHRRDGERQHVVDGVVGVAGFAQGAEYKVEADRAGEQELDVAGVG